MKEHPILFSGPLVRAILSGKKTQTRRLMRSPRGGGWTPAGPIIRTAADLADPWFRWERKQSFAELEFLDVRCPYGKPGDRLWVRETFSFGPGGQGDIRYRAYGENGEGWTPSIHMPRWASRIDLEVTEVRVQRLLEITEEDAQAEGVRGHPLGRAALDANGTHKGAFLAVWEAINGTRPGGSIADNPWVWAVSFKRVQG